MANESPVLIHFYRATVQHADAWRQRLDATTNWSVVSVAAIITFSFSQPQNPHFMLLLAALFGGFFLLMESRRYQTFSLWRHRVRVLNRYLVGPALSEDLAPTAERLRDEFDALAVELGSTRPHISLLDAMGYRLRRNYGFLLGAVIATWLLKLWYHPTITTSADEFVARAAIGFVSGRIVMAGVIVAMLLALFAAIRARSEHMHGWAELPSPLRQWLHAPDDAVREMSFLSERGIRTYEPPPIRLRDIIAHGKHRRDGRLPRPQDVLLDRQTASVLRRNLEALRELRDIEPVHEVGDADAPPDGELGLSQKPG